MGFRVFRTGRSYFLLTVYISEAPIGDWELLIITKINPRYSNNSGFRLDFEFGSQCGVDLKVNIYHIVGPVNGANSITLINILNGC